jgi:hypothetical protein
MLIYSVLGWLGLLAAGDYGAGLVYFMGLEYVGIPVSLASIVLLLIYAARETPWREGARKSIAFGLQILLASIAVFWLSLIVYEQYQDVARYAREDQRKAREADTVQRMKVALRSDNVAAFKSALAGCRDYECDESAGRSEWISRAVLANATSTLAVMLQDLTPQTYLSKEIDHVDPAFCKDGTLYYFPSSLAALVGFRDNPAITGLFMPLWGPKDRDSAFYGATMAGSTRSMEALIKQGVDPHAVRGEYEADSVFVAAARGATEDSFAWLLRAGMDVKTPDEEESMWRELADWAQNSPPDVVAQRTGAWLTHVRFDPGHPDSHAIPLQAAVERNSPALAQYLLHHGWSAKEVPSQLQDRFQQLISRPITETYDQRRRQRACAAGNWALGEGGLY